MLPCQSNIKFVIGIVAFTWEICNYLNYEVSLNISFLLVRIPALAMWLTNELANLNHSPIKIYFVGNKKH